MGDRTAEGDPLAALGAHLGAHGFAVELTARGLNVANTRAAKFSGRVADTIVCRARDEDFGRRWFWTSEGEPVAAADRITDATVFVLGHLSGGER